MARIQLLDGGFEGGGTYLLSASTGTVAASTDFARTGAYSLKLSGGVSTATFQTTTLSTLYLQVANYMITTGSPSTSPFINFQNGTTQGIRVQRSAGGVLQIIRGGSATVLAASGIAYPLGEWNCLEMVTTIAASGTIVIYQDGVEVINYSGDTRPGTNTSVTNIQLANGGATMYFDDIILDTAARSFCSHLDYQPVDSAGSSTQWTPNGAAQNYDCVDERPPDNDTTYVSSATAGNLDLYGLAPFDGTGKTIVGTTIFAVGRGEAGGEQMTLDVKSGATTDPSGTITLTASYAMYAGERHTTDPNTGSAWQDADLDNAEIGPHRL